MIIICLLACMGRDMPMSWSPCGSPITTCMNFFSLSTIWVLGIKRNWNSQPSGNWVGRSSLRTQSPSSFNHVFTHFQFLNLLSPHTLTIFSQSPLQFQAKFSPSGFFFPYQLYSKMCLNILPSAWISFDTLQLPIYSIAL